jgi:hypothetical protein
VNQSNVVMNADLTGGGTNVWGALALKAPLISPSFTTPSLGVASATSLTMGGTNVVGELAAKATTTSVAATETGSHTSPSTSNPLAPGNLSGPSHVIWYGATGEIDLPAAASNTLKVLCIYNTGAFTITLDPNGSEVIVREGTVQSAGISMTLSSGAGNFVWLLSDGVRWITLGKNGTLAAGS